MAASGLALAPGQPFPPARLMAAIPAPSTRRGRCRRDTAADTPSAFIGPTPIDEDSPPGRWPDPDPVISPCLPDS